MVFLVGAGPGHPGLLTLRAVECLAEADLVVYDRLVPVGLLDYAPASAERLCVADLGSGHAYRYPQVQEALIKAAREGKWVVRLKGGDPFLFARGGEEAEALHQAGIPYEIVPGVTAALGAAAFAGIPLTHRLHASAVAFITGHENPDKSHSALDWEALARFPGTLVIYMGMSHLARIVQALINHGKSPETAAAVIHWATTGRQRSLTAPLRDLAAAVHDAGITPPAITIIGSVVDLRPHLAWFERRPLVGKRVLVTRPRHQAADLVGRLERLGAVPYLLPAIEIRPPDDWSQVDAALARLADYHWLVFTSANGVQALIERLRQTGRDLRALGHLRLAAIGPATAEALRTFHLEPDMVPARYDSESLADVLKERVTGQRILLARADRGRELLREELSSVAEVDQVAVYSQIDAADTDSEGFARLCRGEIDYVTLTSSNIARALARILNEDCKAHFCVGKTRIISISPVTSATVRELGLPVAAEATAATTAGLLEALIRLAAQN
jgi:uroporphyrinogen III methyltransferase/synthase